jgi:uncharacterized protein
MRDRAPHRQWTESGMRFPVRTCVACRARRAQSELLRLAKGLDGALELDPNRRISGRGWYVCSDRPECRSLKSLGRFARAEAPQLVQRLEVFYGQFNSTDSVMSQ